MIYYENDYFIFKWDNAIKCVIWERKPGAYVAAKDVTDPASPLFELIRLRKAYKMITDGREMRSISNDDQEWVVKEFIPKLQAAGIRYRALVFPKSTLGKIAIEALSRNVPQTEYRRYFDDIEEAREWLRFL